VKTLLSAFILALTFEASAGNSYIHHATFERLEIFRIDTDNQTGKYYDYQDEKYKTINLSDVSREASEPVDGVKDGDMVLVKFSENLFRPCEVWYLYQNSLAHVGCQTGKLTEDMGVQRPKLGTYTASTESMIKSIKSLEGFEVKDKARLMKDVGDLKKGDLVRIEHIFKNGSAMIQKMGLNLIDTSGLLLKFKVQVVELKDLSLNK
jgi:hypothetical protein